GLRYFHFLQPNQYVPGSKTLGDEERRHAYVRGHPGQKHVEAGYPLLVREGENLAARGVSFTGLTMLFADRAEATYADPCCHLDSRGEELIAERMAKGIAEAGAELPEPPGRRGPRASPGARPLPAASVWFRL